MSLLLFSSLFAYSNYICSFFEIWGDEILQVNISATSPVHGSSTHHQMPIGYLLSHISFQMFGVSDYSIRFAAMAMHSFAFVALFFFIQLLCKNYFVSLLFVLLCAGNFYVLKFSFEGRSQSTALFFLSCFLYVNHKYLNAKKYSLKLNLSLYVCCTLLILTVAFQPPFLLLFIGLLSPIFFYKNFNLKKLILYFFTFILSVVTASPFLYLITKIDSDKLKNITLSNIFLNDLINFNLINFESLDILTNLFFLSTNTSLLIYTILLTLLLHVSYKYKLKGRKSAKLSLYFYLIFIFSSSFTFNFFQHHVNWYFLPKYIYLMIIMFYLSVAFAIHSIVRPVLNRYKKVKPILIFYSIASTILVAINSSYAISEAKIKWGRYPTKSTYIFLKNHLPEGDPAYCIFLWKSLHDCYDIEIYNIFLKPNDKNKTINLFMFEHSFDIENYKKIPSKASHFSILIKATNQYLSDLIPHLNFNPKNIVAVKRLDYSLIYIFKGDNNLKKLIHENLSIAEKGFYKKGNLQSPNFSNYIKKIKP